MSKYSFSKIQLYQQCPLKFRYRYIDKLESADFEETADLLLGKLVHETLEKLYNDINNFKILSKQQITDYFNILWDSKVQKFKDENKTLVVKGDNQLEDFKNRGKAYLSAYYEKNYPFEDIKIVGTEMMLNFQISDSISFQGFIDRVDKVGQDTFVINDYKTNKILPAEDKENYIEQLTLYGFGIQQKYGKYLKKIKARLYFLHFDIIDEREITADDLNNVLEKYRKIIDEIEIKKIEFENNKKVFQACENRFCNYCEFQSICPLFSHTDMQDEVLDNLSDKTVKNLVDEYIKISKESNMFEKQKEYIKELFVKYIEGKNIQRLYGNEGSITISELINYKVKDKEEFIQKMKELGMLRDVLEIDRFKVNKLFKDGKIDKKSLKSLVDENISYVFKSKKNKEK